MIAKLRAFLQGRVFFVARGKELARFMNESIRQGIVFYRTQRSERGLRAQIRIQDFARLKGPARLTHTRVHIIAKYGWPFIAARWWRRKFLLGGILLIGITLAILSQMILSISVSGNTTISSVEIFDSAEKHGLRTWTWQDSVDLSKVSKTLVEEFPDAAWIGIRRYGTRVEIKVVQKIRPQVPGEAGNLVASKAGLVQQVMVIQGTPLIHEGEIVKPGQVLIQAPATVENLSATPRTDRQLQQKDFIPETVPAAKGFVRGRVWYSAEATVPYQEELIEESGKVAKGWGIKFGTRVIMVTIPESPYPLVNEEVQYHGVDLWRNWRLPVEIVSIHYKELAKLQVERTEVEARQAAEERARTEVHKAITPGAHVLEEKVRVLESNDGERVRIEVEAYEDLAVYPHSG
ncbi:sporulation protein YqfD [Desulfitobacterium dichloroeliminans LMG P-21439]|uniref:Sporulation protein YqfD n=1 Tax=Desulfitobacterium dichloroeliminans (strain LMG P-21439 / DCA1) TaxID=871963 RepID=L0FBK0_DESDL|nr:sporulation protein YqfD [Desulfitobacterium dichloroeliminans]AGA70400.1 sporulation protein YqfD [Desulfitobacterium dichloroeliminans LMG P-21439]